MCHDFQRVGEGVCGRIWLVLTISSAGRRRSSVKDKVFHLQSLPALNAHILCDFTLQTVKGERKKIGVSLVAIKLLIPFPKLLWRLEFKHFLNSFDPLPKAYF